MSSWSRTPPPAVAMRTAGWDRSRRRRRALQMLGLALTLVAVLVLSNLTGDQHAGSHLPGVGRVALTANDNDSGGDSGGDSRRDSGNDPRDQATQGSDNGGGNNGGGNNGGGNNGGGNNDGGNNNDDGDKNAGDQQDDQQQDDQQQDNQQQDDQQFPGRDQIGRASAQEYQDIRGVAADANPGQGGEFSGGSYSIQCGLSDHKNSDNPLLAPGKRNGAQHAHDYAGNDSTNAASDRQTLEEASTTCTNGDRTPIFWPVLRDLGGVGPDVGQDGGSLDGNVGSFIEPTSVDYTFHGHGTRPTEAMPLNMVLVTGSAKASTENGEGANAKYTCSGTGGRLIDQYPVCPQGSQLQRVFDFPSCWNGRDLDSEDHTSHIRFPGQDGECAGDETPVPALRISVNYANVPQGRSFAIDSFPDQQHDPITDHALIEYLSTQRRAEAGVECINSAQRCTQGSELDTTGSGSTDRADQQAQSQNFSHALATHAHGHAHNPSGPPDPRAPREQPTPRL